MSRHRGERDPVDGLLWGLGLIALGLMFLGMRQGLLPWRTMAEWWPLFVVAIGLAQMVRARTAKKLGEGVTTLLLGGYFYASITRWYGLNWGTSWPLALVAIGTGTVVEVIASRFMPRRERDENVAEERGHE